MMPALGSGQGMGIAGTGGMGVSGGLGAAASQLAANMMNANSGAAQSSMNVYGPDTPEGTQPSTVTGHRKKEGDYVARGGESPFASTQREVMDIEKRERVKYLPGGGETSAEEYRKLVDAYFRVIAEEGK
jgi:hypothetical protein